MKVRELIAKLETFPEEADVCFCAHDYHVPDGFINLDDPTLLHNLGSSEMPELYAPGDAPLPFEGNAVGIYGAW